MTTNLKHCGDCNKTLSNYRSRWCKSCYKNHSKEFIKKEQSLCPECGSQKYHKSKWCKKCNIHHVKEWNSTRSGENHPFWIGGRVIGAEGYIFLYKPKHYKQNSGYIREHIFLMEEYLQRPLAKDELVHHINGDKTDNRMENLLLMKRGEHTIYHHAMNRINKYKVMTNG